MARVKDRTRGASSIELALYTPILFLVIFGIVQFALSWHANQIASATARETARVVRVAGDGQEAVVQATQHGHAYAAQIGGSAFTDVDISIQLVGADQVRVTVEGRSMEIVRGLAPSVSQAVQGPLEQFRPDL
jgi:Flp pilus assembly protein TadG